MGNSNLRQRVARWLEKHRGLVVVMVVLPLSFIFHFLMELRHWIFRKFVSAPEKHDERVRNVQKQVENYMEFHRILENLDEGVI